ncbi:hypothetical protein BDW75DRAFT_225449 [Aspergillus navahoensis]
MEYECSIQQPPCIIFLLPTPKETLIFIEGAYQTILPSFGFNNEREDILSLVYDIWF